MARGGDVLQFAGVIVLAIGVGLFIGALLGTVAGVGAGVIVVGVAALAFGYLKERAEVTDGARPPSAL